MLKPLAPLLALSIMLTLPAMAAEVELLDINKANAEALAGLPGIGKAKAEAIIKERETHGPFVDAEDMIRVQGIGSAIAGRLAGQLRFDNAEQAIPASQVQQEESVQQK